jgi:hypothetical protein
MERITEDQIARLFEFVWARISDADSLEGGEDRRATAALRLVVGKQIGAIRYYRISAPEIAAISEVHATASWNLLVSIAELWQDHLEFPIDAAVETFEFEAEHPLMSAS